MRVRRKYRAVRKYGCRYGGGRGRDRVVLPGVASHCKIWLDVLANLLVGAENMTQSSQSQVVSYACADFGAICSAVVFGLYPTSYVPSGAFPSLLAYSCPRVTRARVSEMRYNVSTCEENVRGNRDKATRRLPTPKK
ncbi:hypothetical protein PENSPDRAFT_739106, partial [Peniophora sp. CONT]